MLTKNINFKYCFGTNTIDKNKGSNLAYLVFFYKDNDTLKPYIASDFNDKSFKLYKREKGKLQPTLVCEVAYKKAFSDSIEALLSYEKTNADYDGIILEHTQEYDFLSFNFLSDIEIYGFSAANLNKELLANINIEIDGDSDFSAVRYFTYNQIAFKQDDSITFFLENELFLNPSNAEYQGYGQGSFQILSRKYKTNPNLNLCKVATNNKEALFINNDTYFIGEPINYNACGNVTKEYNNIGFNITALHREQQQEAFFNLTITAEPYSISFENDSITINALDTTFLARVKINSKDNIKWLQWKLTLPSNITAEIIPNEYGDFNAMGIRDIKFTITPNYTAEALLNVIDIKPLNTTKEYATSPLIVAQKGIILNNVNTTLDLDYNAQKITYTLDNSLYYEIANATSDFNISLLQQNDTIQLLVEIPNNTAEIERVHKFTLQGYKHNPITQTHDIIASINKDLNPTDFKKQVGVDRVVSLDFEITQGFLEQIKVDTNNLTLNDNNTITITTNAEWEVISNLDFIEISQTRGSGNATITIQPLKENVLQTLSGAILIKRVASSDFEPSGAYVTIIQKGANDKDLKDFIDGYVYLMIEGLQPYLDDRQYETLKDLLYKHYSIVLDPTNPLFNEYGIAKKGFIGNVSSVSDNVGSISIQNSTAEDGGSDYADLSRTPFGQLAYNILKQLKNINIVVI